MTRRARTGAVWITSTGTLLAALLATLPGCGNRGENGNSTVVKLTSFEQRAARRAYDGAPPVIPHTQQSGTCVTCHSATGMPVPGLGYAPANPHLGTSRAGALQNCKQCHVFSTSRETWAESKFAGYAQRPRRGDRLYPGAPPVMPHGVEMRENCAACHTGPAARPEIACSHPTRTNCRQCHVPKTAL